MNKYNSVIHYVTKEEAYFEDFIFSVFEKERIEFERKITKNGNTRVIFDAFLPKGIPGKVYGAAFLEIKYSKSFAKIEDFIRVFRNSYPNDHLVIIAVIQDKDLREFSKYDNVVVLGSSYISELLNNHPSEWWVFVASCFDSDNIVYDSSDKSIHIKNPTLVTKEIGTEVSLNADEKTFEGLSYISESDFKKRVKTNKPAALFLGNGISIDFGSDNWNALSDSLFDYLKPQYIDNKEDVKKAVGNTNYSTTSMSKYLISKRKYTRAIYYSLYRKYEKEMHTDNTLVRSVVRIKEKYKDIPLITYNYDTFVEMDAQLYNSFKIVSVASNHQNIITPEPKIVHIHGLLPFNNSSKKTKMVLTQEEYYSSYKGNSWIVREQKRILSNYTCLFVGSSMSDLYQMSIINDIKRSHYSSDEPYSWKCFALLCLGKMSPKDVASVFSYYMNKGVYIIVVKTFDELPKKLLSLFGLK